METSSPPSAPPALRPLEQFAVDLVAAWNTRDPERVAAFYAPDYEETDVAQARVQRGAEGIRRTAQLYMRAFPDLHVTLTYVVVQGDRLAIAWTWRATHRGTFMHIPPTGRLVNVRGSSFMTIESGKIRHGIRIWDLAGLLRDLGLLPEL